MDWGGNNLMTIIRVDNECVMAVNYDIHESKMKRMKGAKYGNRGKKSFITEGKVAVTGRGFLR